MTSVFYCPKYGCIENVSAYSLLVVSLPDPAEECGYLNLRWCSEEEFDDSYSSSHTAISELRFFSIQTKQGLQLGFFFRGPSTRFFSLEARCVGNL